MVEQQDELFKEIDWQEIWPVKKHIVMFSASFVSLFSDSTEEMIKN